MFELSDETTRREDSEGFVRCCNWAYVLAISWKALLKPLYIIFPPHLIERCFSQTLVEMKAEQKKRMIDF